MACAPGRITSVDLVLHQEKRFDMMHRMRALLPMLLASSMFAQQPAAEPPKPRPMPEPKNLQVLKVTTPQLIGIMRGFNTGLGVQCTFCHVRGDFASDENRHKVIARRMITMNQEINDKLRPPDANTAAADVQAKVTCYTCHRGEEHPKTAPAATGAGGPGGGPNGAPPPPPNPGAPPAPPQ